MVYGGSPLPKLSYPVSLSPAGYPRIIPAFHRRLIRVRDERADLLVKFYLSKFSVYKVLRVAKKVSTSTYRPIQDMFTVPMQSVDQICNELYTVFVGLVRRYIPWVPFVPLHQRMEWKPVWTDFPNSGFKTGGRTPAIFTKRLPEVFAYECWHSSGYSELFDVPPGCLWYDRIWYAFDPTNDDFMNRCIVRRPVSLG